MKQYLLEKIKTKSGQSMVETAFVLPIVMIVLTIVITGSQLIYNKQVLHNSVTSVCRKAIVEESKPSNENQELLDIAEKSLDGGIGLDLKEISLETNNGGWTDNILTAKVTASVKVLIPVLPTNDTLSAKTSMKVEHKEKLSGY